MSRLRRSASGPLVPGVAGGPPSDCGAVLAGAGRVTQRVNGRSGIPCRPNRARLRRFAATDPARLIHSQV